MAIEIVEKGTVSCDQCHKIIARIGAPSALFTSIRKNEKTMRVICAPCAEAGATTDVSPDSN